MANRFQQQQAEERSQEIAHIGAIDSKKLHQGMNKSEASKEKRENKQPNLATGRRESSAVRTSSRTQTEVSGSKRHASAGASPSEPSVTTAKRESKRATITRETSSKPRGSSSTSPTRRNDIETKVNQKPMKGSKTKSKPTT